MSADLANDPDFNDVLPKPASGRSSRLIAILVVVGILGLLVALLLPAVRTAGGAARRSQCVNNLKQIGLALHNYEQVHHALPPAYTVDANGRPLHSWRTLILPYMEQTALYETIDLTKPWDDPANARALESEPDLYRCPEAVGPNQTAYLAIVAPGGCFRLDEPRRLEEITDDHGSTLMVIEAGVGDAVPWMAPVDAGESVIEGIATGAKLPHAGGTNACFVDGSVRFLKATIEAQIRRALVTIAGGDLVSADSF